jgi:hypothetical protein
MIFASFIVLVGATIPFFISFNKVVNFRIDAPHPTYYFNPECDDENSTITDEVLNLVPCPKFADPFHLELNSTMSVAKGCVYNYIVPTYQYYQLHNRPWFAPLAIFTVLIICLLVGYVGLLFCVKFCNLYLNGINDTDNALSISMSLALLLTILLPLLCYIGYQDAPDIRKCSPYLSNIESVDKGVDNGFENIIAGCNSIITDIDLMNRIEFLVNTGVCKKLFYSEEPLASLAKSIQGFRQQLVATIPVSSSLLLVEKLQKTNDEIKNLGVISIVFLSVSFVLFFSSQFLK